MKNEINDNISQKNGNNNNKQINNSTTFSNLNPEYILNDTKNDMKENFAAPVIGSHYIGHKMKNKNENGSKNINNNLGIIDPLVGDPKISEKTLEVFNKSFKKKKTERTFFKLGKNHLNEKGNNIYQENDISINEKENNNSLTNTRYEDNDRYKTLSTSFSLKMYKNIIDPNIKRDGYKKKIIKGYMNGNSKLNQSTYLKYKQFDNEEEEEKRKENSNEKIMNKSFYHSYNKNILTYSKKTLDSKENSFYIYNNNLNERKINDTEIKNNFKIDIKTEIIKDETNKKILQSVKLLISTLSINGLKEVQNEVQKLLSNKSK